MIVKNKKISMPLPVMENRIMDKNIYKKSVLKGVEPILAKIIANRKIPEYVSIDDIINPSLNSLDWKKLKDIDKASDRISDAIINKEVIGLLCDFDVDGISSSAVLYSSFVEYFNCDSTLIKVYISNRMKAGYGFSEEVLDRVLHESDIPTLLITADQGSKDDVRIENFVKISKDNKRVGDVIVTDHHHVNGKGPSKAYAVVNPQREDCVFVDKTICGCTVALLVMVATREKLIEKGYLNKLAPSLKELLTYSTAATIADCVSMASPLNRAIVARGLADMNSESRPAWKLTKTFLSDEKESISVDTIGFGLGPRINACSRTGGNGLVALKFYLADTQIEAARYLSQLDFQNEDRKKTELRLLKEAIVQASELYKKGYSGFALYLEDGHHGIHGIVASRIVERFGRPTVIFSPKNYDENTKEIQVEVKGVIKKKKEKTKTVYTVSGSARSVEGVNLEDCLKEVENNYPDIFLGWGGHPMAAGMSMNIENVEIMKEAFNDAVIKISNNKNFYPIIKIDGELKDNFIIDFNFLETIKKLEPYGNQFEKPIFKIKAQIHSKKEDLGQKKDTAKFQILFGKYLYEAMWFKYDQSPMYKELSVGDFCEMAIEISDGYFRGQRQLNIQIKHANKI